MPGVAVPVLPPKSFLASTSEVVVAERVRRLELLLQQLINTTVFQNESCLFSFFGMDDPKRQVVAGTTAVAGDDGLD